MATLLQVRELPDDVHRVLKARAAAAGTSLSEYVRTLLSREVSRPTPGELAERVRAHSRVDRGEPSEVSVRRIRTEGE